MDTRTPKQKRFDLALGLLWLFVLLPAFLIFVYKYAGPEGEAKDKAHWDEKLNR